MLIFQNLGLPEKWVPGQAHRDCLFCSCLFFWFFKNFVQCIWCLDIFNPFLQFSADSSSYHHPLNCFFPDPISANKDNFLLCHRGKHTTDIRIWIIHWQTWLWILGINSKQLFACHYIIYLMRFQVANDPKLKQNVHVLEDVNPIRK